MKKILFALLIAAPSTLWAAPKPNPADYRLVVHVQASHLVLECDSHFGSSFCGPQLRINVVIDGEKLELECKVDSTELLRKGDYKAKLLDPPSNASTPDYVDARKYEFLFSDGKIREFRAVGESE